MPSKLPSDCFRIVSFGDIMGKPGRKALQSALKRIRSDYAPHFITVNGENAAGGFGITRKIFESFVDDQGIDCVTLGNHWSDKREIHHFLDDTPRLLIPGNISGMAEDRGFTILETVEGIQVAVINIMGRTFMKGDLTDPFAYIDRLLSRLPTQVKIRMIDLHAETTSEKQAMGHLVDGRVSLMFGTHSHVPTADERLLPNGTAYITDLGMTGAYDSVIGIRKDSALTRFQTGVKTKWEPAKSDPWASFVVADIDRATGKALAIDRVLWRGADLDLL